MVEDMPEVLDWIWNREPSHQHEPPVSALFTMVAAPLRLVTLVKSIPDEPLTGACEPVAEVSFNVPDTSVPAEPALA